MFLDKDADPIPIVSTRHVSFDIGPARQIVAWCVKTICNALDTETKDWIIEELAINIIFNWWNCWSELSMITQIESWRGLDEMLAKAAERTKRVWISAHRCQDVALDLVEGYWDRLHDSFAQCSKKDNVFFISLQEIE